MIYHIPRGTSIHRMQATGSKATSSLVLTDMIVTDKEVYYTDKDLVRVEYQPTSDFAPTSWQPAYIFLLPLNARPWWSFRVYEDAIHRIQFLGINVGGPQSERELLQDLKSGKVDPFKTTPESRATDSAATAEEKIVGRPLTPRERAAIKEQWDQEDDELPLNFNVKITKKKLTDSTARGFTPNKIPRWSISNPTGYNWAKDAWLRPLLRPMYPLLPKDLLPKHDKPTDRAEAIAWAIDREIMNKLTKGLYTLGEITQSGRIFYMDYKYSKGK
jgi:hypothetical protein